MEDTRAFTRQLAHDHLAKNDPTGWFDKLYKSAAGDASKIPWADLKPNPNLVQWLNRESIRGDNNKRAIVVGCGLGDDAEELARRGFAVTAFDISPTAIEWCRKRFAHTRVEYTVADALNTPQSWRQNFDFVFESYTLQALPLEIRESAIKSLATLVAPQGQLLVICRARDETDPLDGPPWPLSAQDLAHFERHSLTRESFEDFFDWEKEPVRRFRVLFRRRAA